MRLLELVDIVVGGYYFLGEAGCAVEGVEDFGYSVFNLGCVGVQGAVFAVDTAGIEVAEAEVELAVGVLLGGFHLDSDECDDVQVFLDVSYTGELTLGVASVELDVLDVEGVVLTGDATHDV